MFTIGSGAPASVHEITARDFRPADVRALRERVGLSPARFARHFGISVYSVRGWEDGTQSLSSGSRMLLSLVDGITRRKLPKFELRTFSADDIRGMRRRLGLSQRFFAKRLGISIDSVQKWEGGRQRMGAVSRALLSLIESMFDAR